MRTITVPRNSRALNDLLKQAKEDNLILQTEDGQEFVLAEIDDFQREIELTRNNAELMRLLDIRARDQATISLSDARSHLGLSRRVNRKTKESLPRADAS